MGPNLSEDLFSSLQSGVDHCSSDAATTIRPKLWALITENSLQSDVVHCSSDAAATIRPKSAQKKASAASACADASERHGIIVCEGKPIPAMARKLVRMCNARKLVKETATSGRCCIKISHEMICINCCKKLCSSFFRRRSGNSQTKKRSGKSFSGVRMCGRLRTSRHHRLSM